MRCMGGRMVKNNSDDTLGGDGGGRGYNLLRCECPHHPSKTIAVRAPTMCPHAKAPISQRHYRTPSNPFFFLSAILRACAQQAAARGVGYRYPAPGCAAEPLRSTSVHHLTRSTRT